MEIIMATIDHPSGIFSGATIDGTDLIIPIGPLSSFDGTVSAGSNGGAECVLSLLEALINPVTPLASGGFTRGSVANAIALLPNGSGSLTKTYTFTLRLGLDTNSDPLNIIT
jgi:hypothetical protein